MKNILKLASGLLLATTLASAAHCQVIVQSNPVNIAAVITVNGAPASVTQTGKYNYASVIQAGTNPSATISQNGQAVNSGSIAQTGRTTSATITQGGGSRVINVASVGQSARR